MKNKMVVFVMLVALIFMLLVGCAPAQAPPAEGDAPGEPINLTWWLFTAADAPIDAQLVEDAANAYTKEKLNITVTKVYQTPDEMAIAMAAGEHYDMIFTSEWIRPSFVSNARDGIFVDLTDLLPEVAPDLYASMEPRFWDAGRVDGRIYAVPTLKDMATEMFFRMDSSFYEDELGMELPERMEFADLERFLTAFKEARPDEYPIVMARSGLSGFDNFVQRVVGFVLVVPYSFAGTEKGTTIIPFYEYPALVERYRLKHRWHQRGYINPDAAITESIPLGTVYSSVRSGAAWPGFIGWARSPLGHNVELVSYDGPFMSMASMQGALQAINAGTSQENITASLKYMQEVATNRKFRDILMYGIEDKHFYYLENGTVLRTAQGIANYRMDSFVHGSVAIASVESTVDKLADPDMWTKVLDGYKDAIVSDLGTFSFNPEGFDAEIAAMNAVLDKYWFELRTGTSDPDVVLPQIKEELRAAGLDEVLAEAQRQLDEYIAAKE